MTLPRHIRKVALAALCLAGSAGIAAAEGDKGLEPYQMVRSLQLVQDRIALGDHAALPMQRKLLEMIDKRYQEANSGDFVDGRNFQALLVYAMSGGNPKTIDTLLGRLHLDETERALGTGILGYLNGDVLLARAALDPVEPLALTPDVGAFFALVKGSIVASEDPTTALKMFDKARLLGPGTLVEEAALRRSVDLDVRKLDPAHFLLVSSQYVRRFLRSPYASQFADAFVAGVVTLRKTIDIAEVDKVIARMDPERQKVIYLRLARRAAIEGNSDLTEYASGKADAIAIEGVDPNSDPRTLLYSSLATITSDTVDQVLPKLKGIDRTKLSASDRQLLEAAEAIAAEVMARPDAPAEETVKNLPADKLDRDVAAKPVAEAPIEDDLPEAEPIDAPRTAEQAQPAVASPAAHAETAAPVHEDTAAREISVAAPAEKPVDAAVPAKAHEASGGVDDVASTVVADTRKKLDEIDKLLKDSAQ